MLRRLFYVVAALFLAVVVAFAWYVSSKGFTRKWRSYIVAEFRKAGVEVHVRRLTLDPFRGLVAREVSVLDVRDRKRVLAWIDEVLLGVNYASALRGETFLDSADLREANLWLPLKAEEPDGPKVTISRLNARFFLPPQQIYLARAQAEVQGIQLFASGRLINPQAFHPSHTGSNSVADIAAEVVEELGKLKYGGAPPVLSCEFSGDVAHPEQIQVDLRFHARRVRRKNYEFRTVDLLANYRQGILELQQLSATDAHGELQAAGTYALATQEITGHARCGLHLEEIDHAFRWFPHLEDWELPEPPALDLQAEGKLGPAAVVRVTGHAELRHAVYKHVPTVHLSTDFSWEGESWSLRAFHLTQADGELTGDVTCQPQLFRARLTSTLQPRVFAHLLPPEAATWLGHFDFPTAPHLTLEVHGPEPSLTTCSATGNVSYTNALYQGAALVTSTVQLSLESGVLAVTPLLLEPPTDHPPSTLLFDFPRHEVRLETNPVPEPPTTASPP